MPNLIPPPQYGSTATGGLGARGSVITCDFSEEDTDDLTLKENLPSVGLAGTSEPGSVTAPPPHSAGMPAMG